MNENKQSPIGIIGGSGVYKIDGLKNPRWVKGESSFGEPSDEFLLGDLDDQPLVLLPRHGRGHTIPPSHINYRANIDALKRFGVRDIIAVSAVGSLREHLKPGMFVIVDQYIDRTFARSKSFFGVGCTAHVSVAHPVCARLGDHIESAAKALALNAVRGGCYLTMEGPQFSTLAESELYRTWNCDVIGMTNMPEAKLAREAEICYASIAMVTDFDCWHPNHDDVTVDQVVKVATENSLRAHALVKQTVPKLRSDPTSKQCTCRFALEHAIQTPKEARDPALMEKLSAVARRVLEKQ